MKLKLIAIGVAAAAMNTTFVLAAPPANTAVPVTRSSTVQPNAQSQPTINNGAVQPGQSSGTNMPARTTTPTATPGGQPISPGSAIQPGHTIPPGSAIQPGQRIPPGSAIAPGQPINPGSAIQQNQPNLPPGVGTQERATAQFEANRARLDQQYQNQQSQINRQFSQNPNPTFSNGVAGADRKS